MSEVKKFIMDYFKDRFDGVDEDLAGVDLIEDGYIDSMALYSFVAALEDRFNIQFSDAELMSPDFRKLDTVVLLVERKIAKNNN